MSRSTSDHHLSCEVQQTSEYIFFVQQHSKRFFIGQSRNSSAQVSFSVVFIGQDIAHAHEDEHGDIRRHNFFELHSFEKKFASYKS